jgi:predicted porin
MANALTETTVGDVFANFDGLSRDDRIGYDTPTFAGFTLSSSWVTDDRWDVAARYAGDFGGVKLAAAISYAKNEPSFDSQVAGSISACAITGSQSISCSVCQRYVSSLSGHFSLDRASRLPL